MSHQRMSACTRCGLPVYQQDAVCRDCRISDHAYVALVRMDAAVRASLEGARS